MNTICRNGITVGLLLSACISPLSRAHAENPTILTPAQKAVNDKISQLASDADTALDAGKYALAEVDARKAISLGWFGAVCRVDLAASLYEQGKDSAALEEYKTIVDDKGRADDPGALLPYALLLLKSGQYSQSTDAFNKALPFIAFGDLLRANGPFSSDASQSKDLETALHTALGLTWTGSGLWGTGADYAKALDEFQKALQLSPDNALANLYKGDALKRLGYKAQARDAYAKAAQFGGGDVRKAAMDALAHWQYTP